MAPENRSTPAWEFLCPEPPKNQRLPCTWMAVCSPLSKATRSSPSSSRFLTTTWIRTTLRKRKKKSARECKSGPYETRVVFEASTARYEHCFEVVAGAYPEKQQATQGYIKAQVN